MSTTGHTPSHTRNLVAQIAHDPETAEALFELLVLADAATPRGAALRNEAITSAYSYTRDCDVAAKEKAARIAA